MNPLSAAQIAALRELRSLWPDDKLVIIFTAKVRDEGDPHGTQARLLAAGPVVWRDPPSEMATRFEAFQLGLDTPG